MLRSLAGRAGGLHLGGHVRISLTQCGEAVLGHPDGGTLHGDRGPGDARVSRTGAATPHTPGIRSPRLTL